MQTYLQGLLSPAIDFLTSARDSLLGVALSARRGIDLSSYLGPLHVLGPGFDAMLATLVAGAALVITISLARGGYGLYLKFKQGIKWW